jgi:hypothetical protein
MRLHTKHMWPDSQFNLRISFILLALVLSTCAGPAPKNLSESDLHLPGDLAPADSSRLLEASAILRIIDSSYWSFEIAAVPTAQLLVKRVERHKSKHPDLWARAMAGLAWARDSARCSGQVWQSAGDVRWPYFVRFGPPSAWWVTKFETEAGGGLDTALTFFYRWNELDTGIATQAEPNGSYPTRLLEGVESKSEVAKPIYPSIDVVSFPDSVGTFDAWVITSVRGDELTHETLRSGELLGDIRIIGANNRPVATQSQTHRLGLVGLILSVTTSGHDFCIPFHFAERGLPRGRYALETSIRGYRTNASGTTRREFTLPSPFADSGVSDILLADLRGPQGGGITHGVLRNDRNLQGISEPIFGAGDTLSPYVEFRMPRGEGWACALSVFLKPVLKNPTKTVNVSRSVLSADSLGKPLVRWAGIDLVKERNALEQSSPAEHRDLELIFARVFNPSSNTGVFESSFEVSRRASPGDYWLIIEIEGRDSVGRKFNRSVQKQIEIVDHTR